MSKNIAKKENDGPAISHKESNDVLINYFTEVLPDFDQDRVYVSDIKKVINWYNLIQAKGYITAAEVAIEETTATEE